MIWVGPADTGTTTVVQYTRSMDAAKYLEEYLQMEVLALGTGHQLHKSHILDVLEGHMQKQSIMNSTVDFLHRPWFPGSGLSKKRP
jgi:hypothetical protein